MFEKLKITPQIRRVRKMEALLDEVLASKDKEKVKPKLKRLFAYYFGQKWRKDFEADEKGLFPQDLKRGVLAEDTLYNLYTEYQDILQ